MTSVTCTSPSPRRRAGLALSAFLLVLAVAAVAFAQTLVVVRVRTADGRPAEAEVTLTPEGGGSPRSCRTSQGTCRISNVTSGRYVVTAAPTGGEGRPPIARPVPVPPVGEVTISVTLL
jgi:hypothetical protein